jgi:hypothetical protein
MRHVLVGHTCRHQEVVFLTKKFISGLFWHFIGAGGLFHKKFFASAWRFLAIAKSTF